MNDEVISTQEELHYHFVNYGLPAYMYDGLWRYYWLGISPGSFMFNLLSDSLSRAVMYADDTNSQCLKDWSVFLYNHIDSECWGSEQKVHDWIDAGGLQGLIEKGERVL